MYWSHAPGSRWLFGSRNIYQNPILIPVQPIYNPNTSTTGKQIDGYSWGVTYGGFSLEGVVFTDVVTLGENTWTNMTMEVVTAEPTGSPIE